MGRKSLRPAIELVGDKLPRHVHYHNHLFGLGKTNVTDPAELELLSAYVRRPPGNGATLPAGRMGNRVFLFEVSQPFDTREGRDARYREDLSSFLELPSTLQPFQQETYHSPDTHYTIDICDGQFRQLRAQLLEVGANASKWIQQYFLPLPDVVVSSPEHFERLLQSWSVDPCSSKETQY